MRCGVGIFFQSFDDWDRHEARRYGEPPTPSDARIYEDDLALGDQVEPLGFDSVWTVEHHFSPYTMNPNPMQLLSYFAGRTSRIDVGSMVVVLPWHDPVRVVEDVALLDNLLQGRRLHLGVGRGAAKHEFDGLRIDMDSSRERFLEALAVVRKGLTEPVLEHKGKYFEIPPIQIRPQPRSRDIVDHMYMAWGSPTSVAVAAENDLRPLVVPQKHWHVHVQEMQEYNRIRAEVGLAPARPIVMLGVYVHEDPEVAERVGRLHMEQWTDSAIRHYGLAHPEHFENVKGYEYYNEIAAKFTQDTALQFRAEHLERQTSGDERHLSELSEYLTESHVWGTPDAVLEQLRERAEGIDAEEIVGVFKCGNMAYDVANASMNLFAKEVLPRLRQTSAVRA